jgi:hypothetical protein
MSGPAFTNLFVPPPQPPAAAHPSPPLVDRNSSFSSAAGAKAQFSLSHLRPD